jgi:hypothetical protein
VVGRRSPRSFFHAGCFATQIGVIQSGALARSFPSGTSARENRFTICSQPWPSAGAIFCEHPLSPRFFVSILGELQRAIHPSDLLGLAAMRIRAGGQTVIGQTARSQISVDELKNRLLTRIREAGTGHNVIDVVIVRNHALKLANWRIGDFVSVGNRPVSQDCKDCAYSAQSELQRDLDVIWTD